MSYTMYTPLNVWLDPASVTDVVAYIQTYLSENTIYSETEIETLIHDYLIAHPELIGGVQSVNGKTGTVVLSASDINTENDVTIESVLASLSSQISTIAANVATNTTNITGLTGRMTTAETDISNLKSSVDSFTGINFNTYSGYIAGNGDIVSPSSDNEGYSNKIKVIPGSKIRVTLEYPSNKWMWLVYATYDYQERFISRITVPNSSGNQSISDEVIIIPDNVYYVSFSWRRYNAYTLNIYQYSGINDYLNGTINLLYKNPVQLDYAKNIVSVARGGMQPYYPPNSEYAFKAAYKAGFRVMLVPIRWTSDNIPVCMHYADINTEARNTDGTTIENTIYIQDITLEQANVYDWGIASAPIFKGMKLPTLETALNFAKWTNCKFIIEVKGNPSTSQLNSMYNIINKYNMSENILFSASYLSVLQSIHTVYPMCSIGFGVAPSDITQANIDSLLALQNTNTVFFHVWRNNETSNIITSSMLQLLSDTKIGFFLTEIQTENAFESFINDANNVYVNMVAIRAKPIEQYLYDYLID